MRANFACSLAMNAANSSGDSPPTSNPSCSAKALNSAPRSTFANSACRRAVIAAGVARGTRQGRESIWEIEPARLRKAQGYLDQISDQWDAAIGRLKAFVEEE